MASSRAADVQVALQRAKKKICSLQQHASNTDTSESSPDSSRTTWMPSKELQDSLVDMYTANPRVNVELRQRLPSPARQQLINPDSSHQDSVLDMAEASAQVQLLERNRNVSLLLKELDALREINKKLQDQLIHKEKELQRREVDEQLREDLREARDWERSTAVLEEVLAAQKARDQALMSRLLLANEERDEALLRARRLQQAAELENMNLEDTDMEVDELLRCICNGDSMQEVEHFGSILVQRVRMARQRQNYITAQEMKAVMEERDGSVAKFKRLEQDLMQERERTSKEELLRLQRERDTAVEDRRRLEVELKTLRSNHSSQGHLTPPGSLQAPSLQVQLQQLSKEKQSVEVELQRCQEAEREASERVRSDKRPHSCDPPLKVTFSKTAISS
ncbi:hypothetical protein PAMP_005441 [Pampus punctatissimus]